MKKYIVKAAVGKGKGLFSSTDIKEGEVLFKVDLSKNKSYTPEEIAKMPNNNHADYVGRGRYAISFHPYSYMNHSCNPNIVVKHDSIAKSTFIAMRDIKKGEELTHDYGVGAMDQFGKTLWIMDCKCESKNCRKKIPGDFFKQPKETQRKYYKYLPPTIKRRYKDIFDKLIKEVEIENVFIRKNLNLELRKKISNDFVEMFGKDVLVHSVKDFNIFKKIIKEGKLKLPRNHSSPKKTPQMERILGCDNTIYFSTGFYYVADFNFEYSFIFDIDLLEVMDFYYKPLIWNCFRRIVDYWYDNDIDYLEDLANVNNETRLVVDKYYEFNGIKRDFFDFWRIEEETMNHILNYKDKKILFEIVKSVEKELKLEFPDSKNYTIKNTKNLETLPEVICRHEINLLNNDSFLGIHMSNLALFKDIKGLFENYNKGLIIFDGKKIVKLAEL